MSPIQSVWLLLMVPLVSGGLLSSLFSGNTDYAAIIDAGSTGSRLKVYAWKEVSSSELPTSITLRNSTKYSPSLSSFEDNVPGIQPYLTQIVDAAKQIIPEDKQASTPIMLMATAGMRFLPEQTTEDIMNEIRRLLSNNEFSPFKYIEQNVQVLSGEEEAIYAWIAANYLEGTLSKTDDTYGTIEIGGGSMQIAFVPEGPNLSEEFQVTLMHQLYQVYVQSYLNFGVDGITRQVTIKEMESCGQPCGTPVPNPCLLKGDDRNLTMLDGSIIPITGTGDGCRCQEVLQDILTADTGNDCWPKPCAIGSVYQPEIEQDQKFLALSFPIQIAAQTLDALDENNVLDLPRFLKNAKSNCSRTLESVIAEEGDREREFASNDHCLVGIYTSTLLTQSFGMPMNTRNVFVKSDVGGTDIDWTLGALVLEISRASCDVPKHSVFKRSTNALDSLLKRK